MPSASKNKRKEAARNKERNRLRKGQGAEVKDVKQEEQELQTKIAQEEANRDISEIAQELAAAEIQKKLAASATDVEKLRAEQAAMNAAARNVTGTLTSRELDSSIHIHVFVDFDHGQVMIEVY